MAARAEACQLWIEQRTEQELESGEKSLSEIGRTIAAEIQKLFEATVNPDAIRKRAARLTRTNVQGAKTPAATPQSVATSGYKPKPQEVAKRVEALVEKGASIRDAAKTVAEETGKTPSSVRQAYARERDKLAPEDSPSEAWQFVEMAILQLSRIRRDDPGRKEAFQKIKDWIASQEAE